jgi:glycosyltransferase involved in cell wall biosynthesis
LRVGFFSPLPPARTGVADYSAALRPALGELCEVRVNSTDTDVCLYHLGNNQIHRDIYLEALRQPGVAVLHDATLHHFFLGWLDRQAYIEEFVYNYGEFCRDQASALWETRRRSAQDPRYFEHAMLRRIAEASRAVVVHNPAAARMVARHSPSIRVVEIPHLFQPPELPPLQESLKWRERHGIKRGTFLFGVFGHLRESKRLIATLHAFDCVRRSGADAALLVAGDFASTDLERAAAPSLSENVRGHSGLRIKKSDVAPPAGGSPGFFHNSRILRLPCLPERQFWTAAQAVDACINLRFPSAGETSGITIRMMGIGKPVLVTAGEETSPFPEDACIRIDPGLAETSMLADYMMWLCGSLATAREIGARAAAHIAARHSPAQAARAYVELLSSCGGR